MPRYEDDQCELCGGIRVAKSFLCADCLVKACARERRKTHALQSLLDNRDLEIAKLDKRLCGAVDYGFKQNQENARLNQYIIGLRLKVREVMGNEKDGVRKD